MIIHYRPVNRSAITVDIIQTIVTKKAWNSLNIETHWALPISFRVEILAGFSMVPMYARGNTSSTFCH